MNYGNNQQGGYQRNGYQRNSYQSNSYSNNRNNYQQSRPQRKKSGCKITIKDGDVPIISGWRVSKRQMFKLYARPYKNTSVSTSKNGKEWMNLFVTITNLDTNQQQNCSGMYDIERQRLYIKDFNLIATTKGQGGYFGKHISTNYNR